MAAAKPTVTDYLRQVRKGVLIDKADAAIAEVVKAVLATGKPGSITINLTVKPNAGASDQILLSGDVKRKVPEGVIPDAIFFTDDDGFLHRMDPRQLEITYQGNKPGVDMPAVARELAIVPKDNYRHDD